MTSLQDFADDIQADTVGTLRPKLAMLAHRDVLTEVAAERTRQDAKWGEQNHLDGTGRSHDASLARMARNATQYAATHNQVTWRLILEEELREAYAETDPAKLRTELLQVAAVAVAWAEAIDRRAETAR